MKVLDFLDVTFYLNNKALQALFETRKHQLLCKYRLQSSYRNHQKNPTFHPDPSIKYIQQPRIFNEEKLQYQEALQKAGHKFTLTLNPTERISNRNSNCNRYKNRKRNLTWFNPPYKQTCQQQYWKKVHTRDKQECPQRTSTTYNMQ